MPQAVDPDEAELYANRHRYFSVTALGTFLSTLDGSIVSVVLPTLSREFSASVSSVAWVSLVYSLTLVSLLLVFSAWASNRGYLFAYRFGFSLFLAGSVLCALSPTLPLLIAARVVQAIGGAMFQAVGPGLITRVFPPEERGKGIGLIVAVVSLGLMTGPPLGGFLLSFFSWPIIFWINIPVCLFALIQTERMFRPLSTPAGERRVSLLTGAALGLGLTSVMLALSLASSYSWSDPRVFLPMLVGCAGLTLFALREANMSTALIGFGIFKNKQFTTSLAAMTTQFVSLSGVLILMPFYLERIKGLEPSQVGFYLAILPVILILVAPWSGRLSDRIGYRLLTAGGISIFLCGLLLLSQLSVDSSESWVVLSLVVIALGSALFGTPNSSAFMGSISSEQRPVASGILSATRNIGMSVGVALSTSLFHWLERGYLTRLAPADAFMQSYQKVALVSLVIALVGLPFCLTRANRVSGGSSGG